MFRKTRFLAGSSIYIAEEFSKKAKDRRSELKKFMRKMKKRYMMNQPNENHKLYLFLPRHPLSRFTLRYDKLVVDRNIYTLNDMTGQVG